MTVRIWVDWSGDPGFRFRRGSSDAGFIAACIQHFPASILQNAILLYDGKKE